MPAKFPIIAKLLVIAILMLVFMGESPSYSDDAEDNLTSEVWKAIRDHPDDAGAVCCRAFIDSIRNKKSEVFESRKGSFVLLAGLTETGQRYRDTTNGGFLPATKKNYYFVLPGYSTRSSFDKGEDLSTQISPGAVRYLPELSSNGGRTDKERGSLVVPLSFNSYRVLEYLSYVLLVAALLYTIWVMLIMPVRLLMSIAKGQPFTRQTVKYLFIIGGSLVGFVLLSLLVALIGQLLLSNKIPEGAFFSYGNFLRDSRVVLIIGLGVLLLAIAFRKGLEIKEHNDNVI